MTMAVTSSSSSSITCREDDDDTISIIKPTMNEKNIASLNAALESGGDLPSALWDEWLWQCDLAEPASADCMLNRMHLLGLLISRYRALREPALANVCLSLPGIVNFHENVAKLTPRQLKDVVDCIQVHWPNYAESTPSETLLETVDACLVRFGTLNLGPHLYEDVNMRDSSCEHRMNLPTIRRFVSIFCVLYRHLHLDHFAVEPEEIRGREKVEYELIQDFHVQASQEIFYRLAMHSDLPPAARLLYRQDFSGFYHCVSQVVYFHYPSYERPEQQLSLQELRAGTASPVFTLAPVLEMYPEIHMCYEDDTPKENAWNWFLMGKRVFLVKPDRTVLGSSNLMALLGAFVAETTTTA
jgi:hypothetical protein